MELPHEIESVILGLVPRKSQFAMRCVCKSYYIKYVPPTAVEIIIKYWDGGVRIYAAVDRHIRIIPTYMIGNKFDRIEQAIKKAFQGTFLTRPETTIKIPTDPELMTKMIDNVNRRERGFHYLFFIGGFPAENL